MWKYIEKLRALPERSRKIVVLFSSAFFTLIIMVSWLVFPVPHFGSLTEAEKQRKNAEHLVAPFSIIGGEIEHATGEIKDQWSSLGGAAGILSAMSAMKENMGEATTTAATSTPEETSFSEQEKFLNENNASSTNDIPATTTPHSNATTSVETSQ
jgi:hypothetical protein